MKLFNNKGQSLIELLVAIAVIEIGIFSVWSLFLVNFNAEREAEMRIVGVNLAREGVEVVKNIRDSNWLKNTNNVLTDDTDATSIWLWDQYLAADDYSVNFDSLEPEDVSYSSLYLNAAGFYTNVVLAENKPTPYKRIITLKNICCANNNLNDLKCDSDTFNTVANDDDCPLKIGVNIVSDVTWQISGHSRHALVEDNIYNWK